jgi:hypothetical protein
MGIELSASLKISLEQLRQLLPNSEVLSSEVLAGNVSAETQAVNDRYRCPEKFLDLGVHKQLFTDDGYFQFGPNTTCYGRSSSGAGASRPDSPLLDAIRHVSKDDGRLSFPFNPTEIIENLRLERYANGADMASSVDNFLRRLYYLLRPITNLEVRKRVQRFRARNWEKQPFPKWPVDTTVENICESVLSMSIEAKGADKVPFVWFWPDGATACATLTHDVETEAGRDYCSELMNVDDAFGVKAAFGIVPEERYEVSPSFLDAIRNRGFEIAVQDLNHDGRLFDNREEFLRRVDLINRHGREYRAKGFRAGVLYRKPEWYDALDFAFDMSIPNVAHLDPQHGGCCTVMPYFIGNMVELPVTTTQDYTLFHVLNESSIDLWKTQIELILRKNGLMTFIIHPDYVIEPEKLSIYEALLGYLRAFAEKDPIWFALPAEVDSWWRARSRMSVVNEGSAWRIEGDEAKRAVLAYASVVDGKLIYELEPYVHPEECAPYV